MDEIYKRLLDSIQKRDMSYSELAEKTGIAKSAIQRYATGETKKIPLPRLELLAKALNVSAAYLMGWTESASPLPAGSIRLEDLHVRRVPIVGTVAAGLPILAQESFADYTAAPGKADFALWVEGDSMEPQYLDGDLLFVRAQDDVDDGCVAVVTVDDSATIKHVHHVPGGVLLTANNPKYSPMLFTGDNADSIRIQGVVVGFYRKV